MILNSSLQVLELLSIQVLELLSLQVYKLYDSQFFSSSIRIISSYINCIIPLEVLKLFLEASE